MNEEEKRELQKATLMALRISAISDFKRRLVKIKDKIENWDIESIGTEKVFKWKGDIQNMSLNDYGRIAECGYIIWKFELTREELNGSNKKPDI